MTRETKVGLVVGTGIILLIGIVVSDHLASQQRGQQQTLAPTGYPDTYSSGGNTRTIDPRGVVRPYDNQKAPDPIAPLPPVNNARGTGNEGNGRRVDPLELNNINRNAQGSPLADNTIPPVGTADRQPPTGNAATDAGNTGSNTGNRTADNNVIDHNLPPGMADALRNGNMLEDNTPRLNNPTGQVGDAHRSNPRLTQPRATEPLIHHVESGESLWAIAVKFYGDGQHYTDIARANADKLLPDGGVREGVRLVIPNKSLVVPQVGTAADRGNTGSTMPPVDNTRRIENTPAAPSMRTIEVKPGDALSAIASRELGSMRHMQLIVDANRDQISDANDIKAGMKLKIPALPAASGATGVIDDTTRNAAPNRTIIENTTTRNTTPAKMHQVQPRETFTSIARTRLGSERRWKEIYELNKHHVASPNSLREGVVLVLPTDAR